MKRKWSISEKLLFLTPLLFVGFGAVATLAPSTRGLEAALESLGLPSREAARYSNCQSNMKQITLAAHHYMQDYDEKLPSAATVGVTFGWADSLQPYLQTTAVFHCPKNSQIVSSNPLARGYTDYFYNARLANLVMPTVSRVAVTVMMGEGVSSNARYALSQLPPAWINTPSSPARRHFQPKSATLSGANYAFVDGHIKWLQPQNVGTAPSAQGPTFSIR